MNTPEQIPGDYLDLAREEASKMKGRSFDYLDAAMTMAAWAYRHLSSTLSDTGARWVMAVEEELPPHGLTCPIKVILEDGGQSYDHGDRWRVRYFMQLHKKVYWLNESAPAPLQEKGIREAIEERMKELEALIAAEKRQRADLPRGSAYHLACTHSIDECRIRYEELVKLLKYVQSSSPLPLSDKK